MEYIGLLIGLVAALWVYSDARKRGKSGPAAFLWSLGTFLALIIFLPIWLFIRPMLPEEGPAAPGICSRCRKPYDGNPFYCPNCAHPLRRGLS